MIDKPKTARQILQGVNGAMSDLISENVAIKSDCSTVAVELRYLSNKLRAVHFVPRHGSRGDFVSGETFLTELADKLERNCG